METPVRQRFRQWREVINSRTLATLTDYVRSAYSDNQLGHDQQALELWWLCKRSHGLNIQQIKDRSEHDLEALVQFRLTEEWQHLVLRVSADPPHRIEAIEFKRVLAPIKSSVVDRTPQAIRTNIEAYTRKLAEADLFSGAVLISRAGSPIFRQAYGLANQSHRVANRVDTRFCVGSMNKMFTAVATAQLAQQRLLAFDDYVNRYVPELPAEISGKIKIHHLLTHTAGLGSIFTREFFRSSRARYRRIADYLPLFVDAPLLFEPGERWHYSPAGYIVLGLIIERVSGQSYDDYITAHVYNVAGMPDTANYEMDAIVPNLAYGYTHLDENWNIVSDQPRNNLFMSLYKGTSDGGGFSTVDDLLNFATALLNHRLLDERHTQLVLSPKVLEDGQSGKSYCYGFEQVVINNVVVIGHQGGFCGVTANLDILPEQQTVSIVLSNYDYPGPLAIITRIRDALTGGL